MFLQSRLPLPDLFRLPAGLRWWMVCIPALLLAAVLRLGNPGIIAYTTDEAELSLLAMGMTRGQGIPLLGIPSSVGLPNSPMTVYVMAFPYLISTSPILATAFIALLNVVGVALLGWLAWRIGGVELAGIASLLYAVNPWAVHYSRKIWAQDFHTPIILLALVLGILGFMDGRRWAQVLCLPVLLIGVQIHFAALALCPLWLVFLWMGRARLRRGALVTSLFLSALTLTPYALGLLTQPHAPLTDRGEEWNIRALLRPPGFMLWLATGTSIEQHIARSLIEDFQQQVPPIGLLAILPGGAALLGLALLWRWRVYALGLLLSLWVLSVPLVGMIGALPGALGLPWLDVDAHDLIPIIPVLTVLTGIGFLVGMDLLRQRLPAHWRVTAWGLMVVVSLISIQAMAVRSMQTFVDTHHAGTQFDFSTPLHYLLTVRDALQPYDTVVVVPSNDPIIDLANHPAVWRSLLVESGTQVERWGISLPAHFVLLLPPRATIPADLPGAAVQRSIATVPLRPGEGYYTLIEVVLATP